MASVFRKSAMERLTSPDKLDSMLKVTTPLTWVGLLAAAVLAVAVVIWSFLGSLPTTVSASGFLVSGYNTNTIFCNATGKVEKILVKEGDMVTPGTPVLTLRSVTGKDVTVTANQEGMVTSILVEEEAEVKINSELFRLSPKTDNDLVMVCYVGLDTAKKLENGMEVLVYLNSADSGTYGHMTATITNIDSYYASSTAMNEVLDSEGQLAYMLTQNGPVVAVTCELKTDSSTQSGYYFSSKKGAELTVSNGDQATVQLVLEKCAPISKVFPMLGGK